MTFREARLSLQLEAEERVGAPMRQQAQAARSAEDAAAGAVRAAVEGTV
jgi:hypothetical protein